MLNTNNYFFLVFRPHVSLNMKIHTSTLLYHFNNKEKNPCIKVESRNSQLR